jgi:hypothetical protein
MLSLVVCYAHYSNAPPYGQSITSKYNTKPRLCYEFVQNQFKHAVFFSKTGQFAGSFHVFAGLVTDVSIT